MPNSKTSHAENTTLFATALPVVVGGLVYELILGTTASYLIDDPITSFSLTTGVTLFGMGIGSLLVKYIRWQPSTSFAVNEIALGFIGENSVPILHLAFTFTKLHWVTFSAISLVIGALIGLEIPLLVKMFAAFGRKSSVELLSKVLTIDYFGAFVASLVFPLLLFPRLGLMRSAYPVVALNIAVAVAILFRLKSSKRLLASSIVVAVALLEMFAGTSYFEKAIDAEAYRNPVFAYEQSPCQKIVVTKYGEDLRLYLNCQLQLSSLDEVRYHETLAVSALASVKDPRNVLVLDGGDGLLARKLLKYPGVRWMTVADIDAKVTDLARSNRLLREVNKGTLDDPRVKVVNADAFRLVDDAEGMYDAILIGLVDPSNERMTKPYSKQFYRNVPERLSPKGAMVTQATSSFFSPHAFHTVASTVHAGQSGYAVSPFSHNIPSFGEWGFILSTKNSSALPKQPLAPGTSHQNRELLAFIIRTQLPKVPYTEVSTLLESRIIDTYESGMRRWRYY